MIPICEICGQGIENFETMYVSTGSGACYHEECYEAEEDDCEDEDE